MIDGKQVLEASDGEILKVQAGLMGNVPARFQDFLVTAPHLAIERIIREREAQLQALRDGNPKPRLWRTFTTPGFGTGRNVRFGDLDGKILRSPDFGTLKYGVNKAGYVIHAAVHAARPDVACVIHTHSWASMAVSSLECGLLPITRRCPGHVRHKICRTIVLPQRQHRIRDRLPQRNPIRLALSVWDPRE